jgi:hypothetical protein
MEQRSTESGDEVRIGLLEYMRAFVRAAVFLLA